MNGPGAVVVATAVAWSGYLVHNLAEFGTRTLGSADTLLPTLVWVGAFALWLAPMTRALGVRVLLGWALLNLVGGFLSVLPVVPLPFVPEQTVAHYLMHAVYAAAQVPLVVVCWVLRRDAVTDAETVA